MKTNNDVTNVLFCLQLNKPLKHLKAIFIHQSIHIGTYNVNICAYTKLIQLDYNLKDKTNDHTIIQVVVMSLRIFLTFSSMDFSKKELTSR